MALCRPLHQGDGILLTSEWLQANVLKDQGSLVSVRLLPGSVHQGRHATVAKLQLQYRDAGSMKPRSKTLFIKRSVKQELQPRPEAQWTRDLCSYRNESRFYALFHGDLQAHVSLVTPYAVLADAQAIDGSAFLLVMDCLDEEPEADATTTRFIHVDGLGASDTQQALLYLARLHSAAWGNASLLALASQQLWASGGWWTFAKRGLSPLQQHAPRIWGELLHTLRAELGAAGIDVEAPSIASLGDRLVAQAEYIQQQLSSGAPRALRTLIHGDYKSANLFFEARSREVVAFDWQWTGVGLGAMDVAYLLATSASVAALETEQQLLQFYFDALQHKPAGYSFAQFQRHYVLATLEYAHILMARFWDGLTPATCLAKSGNANCGLGYRSLPHVLRLVRALDQGLALVEREQQR